MGEQWLLTFTGSGRAGAPPAGESGGGALASGWPVNGLGGRWWSERGAPTARGDLNGATSAPKLRTGDPRHGGRSRYQASLAMGWASAEKIFRRPSWIFLEGQKGFLL